MAQPVHETEDDPQDAATADSMGDRLLDGFSLAGPYMALLAAWVATCGSLLMSEVLHWTPCVLCWYQRILMYPLTIIIAIGILRADQQMAWYVLPFSVVGAGTSLYHYLLVRTDWLPPFPCSVGIPCTVEYLNWFGFINVPFLALMAFLIISFTITAPVLSSPSAQLHPPRLAVSLPMVAALIALVIGGSIALGVWQ